MNFAASGLIAFISCMSASLVSGDAVRAQAQCSSDYEMGKSLGLNGTGPAQSMYESMLQSSRTTGCGDAFIAGNTEGFRLREGRGDVGDPASVSARDALQTLLSETGPEMVGDPNPPVWSDDVLRGSCASIPIGMDARQLHNNARNAYQAFVGIYNSVIPSGRTHPDPQAGAAYETYKMAQLQLQCARLAAGAARGR